MKLYRKQIRAIKYQFGWQGFRDNSKPYSDWINEEDFTDEIKNKWSKEIKDMDSYAELRIEERYIEV